MEKQLRIGTLAETSLHAALKDWYGRPGDRLEAEVDGFVIDLVRGEHLIEIQTGNFSAMKKKLAQLLPHHPITVVYPIAQEKWIVRETGAGDRITRRKSPKRGQWQEVFMELVRIPHLLPHPNLRMELLLTQQEEIWRDDGRGSWRRRGWSIYDRRLLAVTEQARFAAASDWLWMVPESLVQPFTNRELAQAINGRMRLAQKMTYTLHKIEQLECTGKRGRAYLYQVPER